VASDYVKNITVVTMAVGYVFKRAKNKHPKQNKHPKVLIYWSLIMAAINQERISP